MEICHFVHDTLDIVLCSVFWDVYLCHACICLDSVVYCEAREFERGKFQILNKTLLILSLYLLLLLLFLIVFNFKVPKVMLCTHSLLHGYYRYYVICITSDTIYVVLFSESKRRHSISDEHNSKSAELYRHR